MKKISFQCPFSINRYKSNRVPKGLFVVAKAKGVYTESKMPEEDFSHDQEWKDRAMKIIGTVNTRFSMDEICSFYADVKQIHFSK